MQEMPSQQGVFTEETELSKKLIRRLDEKKKKNLIMQALILRY